MRQERTRDLASSAPRITHSTQPLHFLIQQPAVPAHSALGRAAPHPANIGADIGS